MRGYSKVREMKRLLSTWALELSDELGLGFRGGGLLATLGV